MTRTTIRAGIFAAAVALSASAAWAVEGGGHGCGGWDRVRDRMQAHVNQMLDRISATPEQRQQIQAVANQMLGQAEQFHAQKVQMHDGFAAEWQKDAPDQARVNQLLDQHFAAARQFAGQMTQGLLQVHGILTPEQRAQLTEEHRKKVESCDDEQMP